MSQGKIAKVRANFSKKFVRMGFGDFGYLQKIPRLSRPEAFLEGSRNFQEGVSLGTFSSLHTFCTPHIMAQLEGGLGKDGLKEE